MQSIPPANQKITDLSSESSLSTTTHTSMSSNEQDSSAVLVYPHKKQQTQDLIDIYQPIGRCNDQHKVDLDEDADGNIFATFHLNSMDSIRLPADSNIMIALAIWVYKMFNIVQRHVIFDPVGFLQAFINMLDKKTEAEDRLTVKSLSFEYNNLQQGAGNKVLGYAGFAKRVRDNDFIKATITFASLGVSFFSKLSERQSLERCGFIEELNNAIYSNTPVKHQFNVDGAHLPIPSSGHLEADVATPGAKTTTGARAGGKNSNRTGPAAGLKCVFMAGTFNKNLWGGIVGKGACVESKQMDCLISTADKGTLWALDRAYFVIELMEHIDQVDSYYVIRAKFSTKAQVKAIYTASGQQLPLPQTTAKTGQKPAPLLVNSDEIGKLLKEHKKLDLDIIFSGASKESRMILEDRSSEQKKDDDSKSKLAKFDAMLIATNAPRSTFPCEMFIYMYSCRWSIEIVIKSLRQGDKLIATTAQNYNFSIMMFNLSMLFYSQKNYMSAVATAEAYEKLDLSNVAHMAAYSHAGSEGLLRAEQRLRFALDSLRNLKLGHKELKVSLDALCGKLIIEPGRTSETYEVLEHSPEFIEKLRESDSKALDILSYPSSDLHNLLTESLINGESAGGFKLFEALDAELQKLGCSTNLASNILKLHKKAAANKDTPPILAFLRPKDPLCISLLKVHRYNHINTIIANDFKYAEIGVSAFSKKYNLFELPAPAKMFKDASKFILKKCLSSSLNIRSYENGSDLRIKLCRMYELEQVSTVESARQMAIDRLHNDILTPLMIKVAA